MKLIAILTPTYNRGYILNKLYDSLCAQPDYNFTWYIVDDGSTDNTHELVDTFNTDKFEIKYIYKSNGGKHTALNEGYKHINEPLTFIVDSDDVLTTDAIAAICSDYNQIKDKPDVCGISYLRGHPDGQVNGQSYSSDKFYDTYINERLNRGTTGDKAEVYKTEVLQQYPFPVFEDERFISEAVVWCQIARNYKLYFVNKIVYVGNYLEDGLTSKTKQLIFNNPLGSAECYRQLSQKPVKLSVRFKYTLAYIAYGTIANISNKQLYANTQSKCLFVICFMPAKLLALYFRRKYGKIKN